MNRYIYASAAAIFFVVGSYFYNFYVRLNIGISRDVGDWGVFGDFVGGALNPVLTFFSIALLIKSLTLQLESNKMIRDELTNAKKSEKIRSFETLFFNMINSQRDNFSSFHVETDISGKTITLRENEAVIFIEDAITNEPTGDRRSPKTILDEFDRKRDQIFGAVRIFYIIVKMVSERLSEENGFSREDRVSYLNALINFTDFSLLRLICLDVQFRSYPSSDYLKNNPEFMEVFIGVGLGFDLYGNQQEALLSTPPPGE